MKIVLDANVLIAAFATQGLCHAVFELCLDQQQIVLSGAILNEVAKALGMKLKVPAGTIEDIRRYLIEHASIIDIRRPYKKISRDPNDDHVLALASESKADYIITGDKDLLVLEQQEGTLIVQPRQFWEILKMKDKESH
jgi:uncharacterized protein